MANHPNRKKTYPNPKRKRAMSITKYEPIMEANANAGRGHTVGMTTAQAREYLCDQTGQYEKRRREQAHHHGFQSVVEYETAIAERDVCLRCGA